ncbi:zinc finger BED domain-containing protein RICESLEEPER 2-like [Rhizophagus irregularis DAOM 181602=DAOM 197198]|nr:zinc finger BED domain-containing protein RICESLEEPER 2-like [Rhizophagus irregularis DAOM 181602=DAOM 197198]
MTNTSDNTFNSNVCKPIRTKTKSLEYKETDDFLDEIHKKRISDKIRQRNKEKKIQSGLITSKLLQILEEFSISNDILALTTDNRSNMIACGNQLATELDQEFNNMAFTHYRCAAHIINLAVKAGMNHVGNEIKKLCQFVVKIKNSPLFLDKLSEICTLKKVKFLKPILNIDIC